MKTAFLFFFFLIIAFTLKSHAGLPPTTLSGMDDATKTTTFNFKVPNKQSTKVTGGTLVETGNKNRLANPGFEDANTSNFWFTSCTGTANPIPSAETTNPIEGNKSVIFTISGGASGGACNIYQDVTTLYALDGIVSMYVKSDTQAGVVFIKRVNGAESVRFDPNASNTYRDIVSNPYPFKIPGAMGTTSTGVGVEVTVAASQTIIVTMDEAKVALEDVKQDTSVCTEIECETEFTARLNGSTCAVISESTSGWITSSVDTGVGVCTIDFTALGLTQIPAIESTVQFTSTQKFATTSTVSTTAVTMYSYTSGTTLADPQYYNVTVSRQGVDAENAKNYARRQIYSTAADFFSTDTNTLAFKATAITDIDPVGTFNTYSYDGAPTGSNNKTICGSTPTQSIADMKTNGIKIFTRAYNADSSCVEPARVEVKIAKAGTSLPTLSAEIYKNIASTTPRVPGTLDVLLSGSDVTQYGATSKSYDKNTGVFTFDAGFSLRTSVTQTFFTFSDNIGATSGYLVINAQPKKTTAVQDFGEFDYVSARYTISTAETIGTTTGTLAYKVKYEDTHSAYNTTTGEFTVPLGAGGKYRISGKFNTGTVTLGITNNLLAGISINGTDQSLKLTKGNGGNTTFPAHIYDEFTLEEGDVVKIVASSSVATTTTTDSRYNSLTITRIPGQFR